MDAFKRHTEKKCWKERMSDIEQETLVIPGVDTSFERC